MTVKTIPTAQKLLFALEHLRQEVEALDLQPQSQLVENAVLQWQRVLDGKEKVQMRLGEGGYYPLAFYFGMEPDPHKHIETSAFQSHPIAFPEQLNLRLATAQRQLQALFVKAGYRPSSDQCDQLLVEMSRFSRFLGVWCYMAEQLAPGQPGIHGPLPPNCPPGEAAAPCMLPYIRWNLFYWEPLLNDMLVSWEENLLEGFIRACDKLLTAMEAAPEARNQVFSAQGYPLRGLGQPRMKVVDEQPEGRPLRGKNVAGIRFAQLTKRLQELGNAIPQQESLLEDVLAVTHMVHTNRFFSAGTPGFSRQATTGTPLIRVHTENHPLLLDAKDFFKKAMLFSNGTYTAQGAGADGMYLLIRQLERHLKFQPGSPARQWTGLIGECVLAWEENRREAFTTKLMTLAEHLRKDYVQA